MANVIMAYKVKYAPYSASAPTTWTELKDCIRKIPNFFPDPETVDATCVDHTMKHSIQGLSGGEAFGFTVAPNKEFLESHIDMVTEQEDESKGSFWLEVEYTNRNVKVSGQFTTVKYLPTPEGEAGNLDEITWNVYPASDLIVSDMTSGGNA